MGRCVLRLWKLVCGVLKMEVKRFGTGEISLSLEEIDLKRTDLDKTIMKSHFRKIGAIVRRDARRRVQLRRVSKKDEFPGKKTGAMAKAIKVKLFRNGFGLTAYQDVPDSGARIKNAKWKFYPAFLRFGVRNKKRGGWRLAPRKDYINDAVSSRQEEVMGIVMKGLEASLKGIFAK